MVFHIVSKASFRDCFYSISLLILLLGCAESGLEQKKCILESLQFDSLYRLEFTTLSGGRIHQVKQYFDFEGESKVVASFSFNYYKDSLSVGDQFNATNYRYPFLTAQYRDDQLRQVVKFFPQSEIRLVHELKFLENDQLRVELTRVASNGDSLFAAYSLYEFDVNGNVSRLLRYGIDQQDRSKFILYDEIEYIYDDYLSPVVGLFLPFFTETNTPDVRFFSKNNIISENRNGSITNYSYQYGPYKSTLKQNPAKSNGINFGFVNCE